MSKIKYESRYFFKDCNPDLIFILPKEQNQTWDVAYSFENDKYLLTTKLDQVVKIRNEKFLEIKNIVSQTNDYKVFEKKVELKMPVDLKKVLKSEVLKTVTILKKRFKYKGSDSTKFEFSKIEVGNKIFYTFCIESKDKLEHELYIEQYKNHRQAALRIQEKIILSYTEFLQWLRQNDNR